MSTPPTFRSQGSVWSLSDDCFVIPQYDDTNSDLIPPLVTQARAMLGTSDEPLQIVRTEKWVATGDATTTTGCPTGDVPPTNDPVLDATGKTNCQSQPPYTLSLPKRLTVVSRADASPLVPTTADYMTTIKNATAGTGFWVLWDSQNKIYLVTFPPPPNQPPFLPPQTP